MRIIITSGTLTILAILIIATHSIIVNKNAREVEVSINLEDSADYAIDKMLDCYIDKRNDIKELDEKKQELVNSELMAAFCASLSKRLYTDGEIEVTLIEADLNNGIFDILIKETFDYHILGKSGCLAYERAFSYENK